MNINYWNHIESMAVVDGTQQIFPKNILSLFDFLNLRPVYPMNQSYAINSRDSLVIFFIRRTSQDPMPVMRATFIEKHSQGSGPKVGYSPVNRNQDWDLVQLRLVSRTQHYIKLYCRGYIMLYSNLWKHGLPSNNM